MPRNARTIAPLAPPSNGNGALQQVVEAWREELVPSLDCVTAVAQEMGEADLMRCCVVHLCAKAVADPDFRRRVLKKLTDHRFAAAGRDAVRYRSGRAKHPLPAGLAFDARRSLVRGNHGCRTHLGIDASRFRGERCVRAAEYIGDGAFADFQPEQPFEHLHQPVVADHVAGVQIDRQPKLYQIK